MTEITVDTNQDNGREFRTVTASTKVTDQELAQLEKADPPEADPEMVEIVGLQMFLTRILTTIACGDRMSPDQCQELMRNVRANKHRAARDAMVQYRKQSEEEHHG